MLYPFVDGRACHLSRKVIAQLVYVHPVTMEATGSFGSEEGAEIVKTLQKLGKKAWHLVKG